MAVRNLAGTGIANARVTFFNHTAMLANGDTGSAFPNPFMSQGATSIYSVYGVFGVGGSINFEGSADGVSWTVISTDTVAVFLRGPLATPYAFLRFNVTAGDGTTSLAVRAELTGKQG